MNQESVLEPDSRGPDVTLGAPSTAVEAVSRPEDDVSNQELKLYWRLVLEARELLKGPLSYAAFKQVQEIADDIDLVACHTKLPALRARCIAELQAWRMKAQIQLEQAVSI